MTNQPNPSHFARGSGCYTCRCCGKRTRSTGRGDNEHQLVCAACYDLAGIENEHADGYHKDEPASDCPLCAAEKEVSQ